MNDIVIPTEPKQPAFSLTGMSSNLESVKPMATYGVADAKKRKGAKIAEGFETYKIDLTAKLEELKKNPKDNAKMIERVESEIDDCVEMRSAFNSTTLANSKLKRKIDTYSKGLRSIRAGKGANAVKFSIAEKAGLLFDQLSTDMVGLLRGELEVNVNRGGASTSKVAESKQDPLQALFVDEVLTGSTPEEAREACMAKQAKQTEKALDLLMG
jgi:hypothetical protein